MNKAIVTLLSRAIVERALDSSYPNKCPDKIYGKYNKVSSQFEPGERDIEQNEQECAIILVLESPHTYEFDSDKHGIGPAKGPTGRNIKKYLGEIIDEELQEQAYDLVLINAIQLQCSLGCDRLHYRDAMFLYHWEQEKYRRDFRDRLETIVKNYCKGGIVINCCTKGEHNDSLTYHSGPVDEEYLKEIGFSFNKNVFDYENDVDTLQGIVEKEIKEVIEKESENKEKWKHFVGKHPYSWFNENNRKIKYKIKENE